MSETFRINGKLYDIEKVDGEYVVRCGGSRIYGHTEIAEARNMLHTYACNQLRAEISSAKNVVTRAEQTLKLIDGDPFYLGKVLR